MGLGIAFVAFVAAAVGAGIWGYIGGSEGESDRSEDASTRARSIEEPLAAARRFYETRPYYQSPRWNGEIPEGLSDIRAETCGNCHQEIYREWQISTHRRAWKQDPQFMAELEKSRSGGHAGSSDDVGWMCVTCHTPNIRQMERLVVGLEDGNIGKPTYVDNPRHDPEMEDEAITCATCHVRDGKVYGPWGTTDAPHPTARAESLRSPDNCTSCHQAEQEWPSRNLACFFNTGDQFESSDYAEQGKTCQSCHMPTVHRKLAKGFDRPKRKTRRHWFGGSLIPKRPEYEEEMERLESVYGSGADIELLADAPDDVRRSDDGHLDRSTCESDACRTVWIRITNANAGHKLPTGDPERHIDVRAVVRTPDDGVVTRAEYRLASKYEWWPEIKKLFDNRLDPGAHVDVPLDIPADASSVVVDIRADKYRMYMKAFEHHDLDGKYVRGRPFHRSSWELGTDSVPTRTYLSTDTRSSGDQPEGFLGSSDRSESSHAKGERDASP